MWAGPLGCGPVRIVHGVVGLSPMLPTWGPLGVSGTSASLLSDLFSRREWWKTGRSSALGAIDVGDARPVGVQVMTEKPEVLRGSGL